MNSISNFARQALAGLGALAITATLLVASFSTEPQMIAVSGMLA